jgi:hypothetical protein
MVATDWNKLRKEGEKRKMRWGSKHHQEKWRSRRGVDIKSSD